MDLSGLHQICWVDDHTLIGVVSHNKNNNNTDSIVVISFSAKEGQIEVQDVHATSPNGKILRLIHNSNTGSVFVELNDGRVYRYSFSVQGN